MSLKKRLLIAGSVLAIGLIGQAGLLLHLSSGASAPFPQLRQPLAAVPLELQRPGPQKAIVWKGQQHPRQEKLREELPFHADDLLSRYYVDPKSRTVLNLYLVHSRKADDRKHHPEICIRDVLGAPEVISARKILFLSADKDRPVQRFRFQTQRHQQTTVYYWHYTFRRAQAKGQTAVQSLHERLSHCAPSITVQISTTESGAKLGNIEKDFLITLDHHLRRTHLPADIRAGIERQSIIILRK